MRLKRIDVFRLFAIYMVVWAHSQFFDGIKAESVFSQGLEIGIVLVARFSMQFFFIVSGYFVGGKIIENQSRALSIAWKQTQKLLPIFLVWFAVYALEDPQAFMKLAMKDPLALILEGPRLHLWFLVSMILTIWLFAVWPLNKKGSSFLVFGMVLYIMGLLGGPYINAPIGVDLHFNTRDGVFFSTLFFAIGVLISSWKPRVGPALAWGIYFAGFVIFSLETFFLWATWSMLPVRHDYLIGSVPYGIGAFFMALTARRETKLDTLAAPYSKYVLGIYVSHLLFLDLWKPLGVLIHPVLWSFLFPILVFGSSLLAVILLSKTPLRRFVI